MAKTANKPAKRSKSNADVNLKVVREKSARGASASKKSKKTKLSNSKDKQTRIEILQALALSTGLPKVQIENVFQELANLMTAHLCKKGSGEIAIPFTGIKLKRIKKKASKARKMISPLIGQEVEIAAKPARNAVKVIALKILKDMVEN